MPINTFGYSIAGELQVLGKFDAGIVAKDPGILQQSADLGRKLATALEKSNER